MFFRSDELLNCSYTAVDVETTGLFPQAHDRVIEIAAVRFYPDGTNESAFVTLLNPERDIGPTRIHGIRAGDVKDAPRFEEISGDLLECLHGSVLVAHNARFDWGFIRHEFERAGVAIPKIPSLCTLSLLGSLGIDVPNRRLSSCRDYFGLKSPANHSAEDDARCVAELLRVLIAVGKGRGYTTLGDFGCECDWPSDSWPRIPPSGKKRSRQVARLAASGEDTYLGQLIRRLPLQTHLKCDDTACMYFEMLDRALEDRRLSREEGDLLFSLASEWGLTQEDVIRLHREYLSSLVRTALADDVITDAERDDIEEVASCLALGPDDVEQACADAETPERKVEKCDLSASRTMQGMSVCFTGELLCQLNGQPISRAIAEQLAANAGLTVAKSVTKKLDLLVVADPDTMSGKAKKARDYGTRIIAERVFWNAIGVRAE